MRFRATSCITATLTLIPFLAVAMPPAGHDTGTAPYMLGTQDTAKVPAVKKDPNEPHTGKVIQVINSGGYSYIQLKKKNGEKLWLAITAAEIPVGSQQTFSPGMVMPNFESKTLKRTFDEIIFTELVTKGKESKGKKEVSGKSPGSKGAATPDVKVKVKKASGKNAYTISELYKNKAKLHKKKVVVNGKVIKVSSNIMGKNWIHLRDGSGSQASGDANLVVTSKSVPAEGEIVTVTGTLFKNKDFGSGYKYDVIIEDAEFTIE